MSLTARTGAVVYAGDVSRLARFYQELLGMVALRETAEFISLEHDGFNVIIHVPPFELDTDNRNTVKLFFTVDSLQNAREKVVKLGGKSLQGLWSNPIFRVCNVVDPEGNPVQLREFIVKDN